MDQMKTLLTEVRTLIDSKSPNMERARDLVVELRVLAAEFDMQIVPGGNVDQNMFMLREVLEAGATVAILGDDDEGFERYMTQLKPFYNDFQDALPESQRQYPLIGAYLLYLLVSNRIGEFHTELELVRDTDSRYIKYPVQLEQDKMEGRYNRVISSSNAVPDSLFEHFTPRLRDTVRHDILSSLEKSYDFLTKDGAKSLLMFTNLQELDTFIDNLAIDWTITPEGIHFNNTEKQRDSTLHAFPVIKDTLQYAHEIERII